MDEKLSVKKKGIDEKPSAKRDGMDEKLPIKMIALDLDGTTLDQKGQLTRNTAAALEQAAAQGVEVVIATGRCFTAVPQEIKALKGLRYLITSNGARISDLRLLKLEKSGGDKEDKGKIGADKGDKERSGRDKGFIYSACLSPRSVRAAMELLQAKGDIGYGVEVFTDGEAFIGQDVYDAIMAGKLWHRNIEYVSNTRIPVPDIYAFARDKEEDIENISIFFDTAEGRLAMEKPLHTLPEVTVTTSFSSNWEIGGQWTAKGNALGFLMAREGISRSHVMAFGDSPNDATMLLASGYPVAVGNAKEPVKAIAWQVTKSNAEEGVAHALAQFVLL